MMQGYAGHIECGGQRMEVQSWSLRLVPSVKSIRRNLRRATRISRPRWLMELALLRKTKRLEKA